MGALPRVLGVEPRSGGGETGVPICKANAAVLEGISLDPTVGLVKNKCDAIF